MKTRLAVLTPALAILAFAAPAGAATSGVSSEAVSENWAGYEATTTNADGFSAVSGSWVQPKVSAANGQSYSAYWVGLGGGEENSDALEQDGTQADVSSNGTVSYYAWYELVPSAPVKIPVTVHAGDKIYARTYVKGTQVTFTLDNKTTGVNWTKTVTMTGATPDTSTAEWVAEAPSECDGSADSSCSVLNLADFGTVKFTDAHARSDGQVKSISGWDAEAIEMSPASGSDFGYGGGYGGGFGGGFSSSDSSTQSTGASEGAAPSALSSNGSAFSVTYGSSQTIAGTSGASTGGAGAGSGDASGYGYGDSSGYGYGYGGGAGYGDSGYGDSAYGYGDYGYGSGAGYGDASSYGDAGYGELGAYEQAVLNALSGYGESYYGGGTSAGQGYGY